MIYALALVSLYAVVVTWLHVHQAAAIDTLMKRWMKANGQFVEADTELNKLKIAHAQTLMQLEDARK